MAKKFRSAVFSFLLIALTVVPASVVHARQEPTEQELAALLEKKSVLVEAYLLQVSNEALSAAGVAPVPQNSTESATVLKLLQCMVEPENGRVISSAGVTVKINDEAETSSKKTRYLPRKKMSKTSKGTVESVSYSSYSTSVDFNVRLYDMNDDRIRMSFEYKYRGLDTSSEACVSQESPPDTVEFSAQSSPTIPLDKAIIISSSQEEGTSMFFILRTERIKQRIKIL